jgi:hypothetical protein
MRRNNVFPGWKPAYVPNGNENEIGWHTVFCGTEIGDETYVTVPGQLVNGPRDSSMVMAVLPLDAKPYSCRQVAIPLTQ